MPTTTVRSPDGELIKVRHPEGASEAEIIAYAKAQAAPAPAAAPANPFYDRGAALRPSQRDMLSAFQGPTFGFGDELLGATAGGIRTLFNDKPYQQNYENARDFVRGAVETQQKEAPVQTAVTQFAASLPLGGPLARLLPGATGMAGQAATAAGVGAVSGAINATGDSKATDASGLASDALKGGGLGLAMGGLGVPILRGAGAVGSVLATQADQVLTGSPAMQYARQKVAEAFARDQRSAQQAATRMDRLGPEATVVDTGGQNTRQLLDTLAILPGQTKNQVETVIRNRQAGRADRMIDAAESASGTGGLRMSTEMSDWMTQRAQAAAPLYERVHKIDIPATGDLAQLVDIANRNGFNGLARRIADYDRVPFSLPESAVNQSGQFSVRDLDYLKRAMDTQIAKLVDPATKAATAEGRALTGLRDELVSRIDKATFNQYKVARDAWAGPSQMMDAANAGRMAMTKDDATITAMQAGMSRAEKDAFALGAFESLRAKLGARAGQTQIMELWREKGLQEKLKAIFGNERAYREFASSVAKERQLKQLESVGRGSQTAARMYGAGDLDVPAVQAAGQAVSSVASGNPMGIVQGVSNLWNRVKLPEPVRDQMGQILLSRNRQGLLDLEDTLRQVEESRRRNTAAYGISLPAIGLPGLISP